MRDSSKGVGATSEDTPIGYEALVNSASMRLIDAAVTRVAPTDVTVLISGESGVGKELVARMLHQRSRRRDRAFVKVNCAALPLTLLESELFGYERGAFTGADHQKRGKFEQAHRGTIFLDEISEMPLSVQAKLLQVLQDHEFARLGSDHDIRVDVRVVAATNRDLNRYVAQGGFREDLFHRLNVVHVRVPPLRERREEIPVLIEEFRRRFNVQYGRQVEIPQDTVRVFFEYHWPGNIRELENAVKRIVVLGSARPVHQEIITSLSRGAKPAAPAPPVAVATTVNPDAVISLKEIARQAARDAERVAIKEVLDRVHWNRAKAARLLQISYKALLYKIVQCGLVVQEDKDKEVVAS